MNSSYHVRTNMSVRRVVIQGVELYVREMLLFSLVCTLKRLEDTQLNVVVQKGVLRF